MKTTTFVLFLCIYLNCFSQEDKIPTIDDASKKYGFIKQQIKIKQDTITYFLKKYNNKPKNVVVYIQGTDANPIFSYSKKNGKTKFYRWFGDEYKTLDSTYTYAIVPKPAIEKLYKDGEFEIPNAYYEKNYLAYRVKQIDLSINHIIKNHLEQKNKVIIYGHSEGAVIGAALANINKKITHLGFWSGNVLNNFYEFALFNRIESIKGNISDKAAHDNISGIISWYKSTLKNPNSTELDHFGFTNKRWTSYEKAPIDFLLKLNIPIYSLFGTEDESTPIETAYLLPIKFIENRKENLTFKVCIGCDHAYKKNINGKQQNLWNDQFINFIKWTDKIK